MDRIACLYFEGNDSKIALFEYGGGKLTLLRAESLDTSLAFAEQDVAAGKSNGGGQQDNYNYYFVADESSPLNRSYLQKLNDVFRGEDFKKCRFIPILTEPAVYFQRVNDTKDFTPANVNGSSKATTIVDFFDMYDNAKLAIYTSGRSGYLRVLDSLAQMNGRRVLRIPAVKSAEISLASYVARKRSFNEDETSLVLYVGKEYSKLIFLRGAKLLHICSTISVGKNSFNAHNVMAGKILLEMEHVSLGHVQNIIMCGEDQSDELVATISEAFPRSRISLQHVESVDVGNTIQNADPFIVPTAVAEEYLAELDRTFTGINLLPQYLKEEQKVIHLGWQGYLMIALIVASTAFFAMGISSNAANIQLRDSEMTRIAGILEHNRDMLAKIKSLETRIQNVDQTKAVLNRLSAGSGIVGVQMKKLSGFAGKKGNLWISQFTLDQSRKMKLAGFTFSRMAVKELSDSYDNALLQNMIFDPLKDTRAFKFLVTAEIR